MFGKKKKSTPPASQKEWWEDGYEPVKPTKRASFFDRLGGVNLKRLHPSYHPIALPTMTTVKCITALILFSSFLLLFIASVPVYPMITFLVLPTLWIFIDYIKLARKSRSE